MPRMGDTAAVGMIAGRARATINECGKKSEEVGLLAFAEATGSDEALIGGDKPDVALDEKSVCESAE